MFWSFGLLVGGLVVSVAMSLHVLRAVTVHRLLPTHGVAGEAMVLRYRITNTKSWMPVFNLIITETWGKKQNGWKKIGPVADPPPRLAGRPYGWGMHLGPKQSVQAEAPCWPSRRGVLHFERIELTTSFPFGVIRCALVVDHVGEVLIFPHLYRINRRLIHRMHQIDIGGADRRERPSDTGDFFGLRSYRPGDSLKMIDWKHSARTGELICREMTRHSPPKVMLALDLIDDAAATGPKSDKAGPAEPVAERHVLIERAVSLAASVICDAHLRGYQIGLIVHGVETASFPIHHSLPHRTRMLEALARLETSQPDSATAPPAIEPSVLVRLGFGQGHLRNGHQLVLGAANMDQYVSEAERSVASLMDGRAAWLPRRYQSWKAAR